MDANKYVPTEEEIKEALKVQEDGAYDFVSQMPEGKAKKVLMAYCENLNEEQQIKDFDTLIDLWFDGTTQLDEGCCEDCPFAYEDKYGFTGCKINMLDGDCCELSKDYVKKLIKSLIKNDYEKEFNKKYDQMKQVLIDQINRKESEIAINKAALEKACHKLGFTYVKGKNCDITGTECKADKDCEVCLKEHFLAQAEDPDGNK